LEHVPPRRLAAEVMVEGDDTVHLGARQVERIGQGWHDSLRHAAQHLLHLVENLDQLVGRVAMLRGYGLRRRFNPYRHPCWHWLPILLSSQARAWPMRRPGGQSFVSITSLGRPIIA